MLFLDTHIIVWMYQDAFGLLTSDEIGCIENSDIYISPMVKLEIEYLYETGKIKKGSETILRYLYNKIGLAVDDSDFRSIIENAFKEKWTRDPFDRIIVAHAKCRDAHLMSRDKRIKKYYSKTIL